MSETPINKPLEPDWERVDAMGDDEIDTSDIPPLTKDFFKRAVVRLPDHRIVITMHIDPDVLAWFQAQGDDYERRMHAALRIYADAHRAA